MIGLAPSPPPSPPYEDCLPVCTIVADDFGISEQRNLGIVHAMLHGVVTHTSIMANGAAAAAAVALAHEHGLSDRVNLHLNLTEGRPLLRIRRKAVQALSESTVSLVCSSPRQIANTSRWAPALPCPSPVDRRTRLGSCSGGRSTCAHPA